MINVASTAQDDQKSGFSGFGTWVDISEPGSAILSSYHVHSDEQNDYVTTLSGTSMASPVALGVAALIWSANPSWSPAQVKQHLFATADSIDAVNPAYIGQLGAGRVNAFNAVANGTSPDEKDLIVIGRLCVGLDCTSGESFGFDTIRLKENNLCIKAQDTSSSASFPSNDWQITFNDSANGGANKFSIDDIDGGRTPFTIEAGAPFPMAM